jgi:tetratricopeptide (TPR) repeat protein
MKTILASRILAAAAALCAGAALAQQADDPLARARALAEAGKLTESETILRAEIQRDPASADAHFLLGYDLFREQKARESLAEFTAGAHYRRPAADDFRVIASDYVLLADYTDAEKWFSEVVKDRPQDPDSWYLLGRAQYNEDRFSSAAESFQRALSLRPQFIEAENNLGLAWQGLNDSAQAMTAFQTAIGWQGDHPADAQPYLNLGGLLFDQGQPDKALPFLREAAALAPKNPKAHERLGRAWEAENNLHEAQQELEAASALAPDVSGLHFELGRLYQREGLRDLAKEQFGICARLDSTHSSKDTPNPPAPH